MIETARRLETMSWVPDVPGDPFPLESAVVVWKVAKGSSWGNLTPWQQVMVRLSRTVSALSGLLGALISLSTAFLDYSGGLHGI